MGNEEMILQLMTPILDILGAFVVSIIGAVIGFYSDRRLYTRQGRQNVQDHDADTVPILFLEVILITIEFFESASESMGMEALLEGLNCNLSQVVTLCYTHDLT